MKLSYKAQLTILMRTGILIISAFLIVSAFSGCKSTTSQKNSAETSVTIKTPKVTYDTVEVKKGTIINSVSAMGTFIPVKQQDLFLQPKGGNITKIYVKVGDKVKAGNILAEINTDDIQEQIEQQKINIQIARIDLEQTKSNKEASNFDIQKAQLALEKEELTLDNLNSQLNETKLVAGIDGTVTYSSTPKIGQYINPYTTVFTIADPTSMQIECTGDKLDTSFKVGMKVNIIYGDKTFAGIVATSPDDIPDNIEKYIKVKMDSIPAGAKLGATVNITVEVQRKDNVIVVNKNLIKEYAERPYVELLVDGVKVDKFIETGIESENTVEVVKGLKEGDKIIK